MVVLVDGAAHGTQAVVAVGEGIGNGELLHAGGPGLLDDAHIGDVVGHHGIEADLQLHGVGGCVMGLQDPPGHGVLPRLPRRDGGGVAELSVVQENTCIKALDHSLSSLCAKKNQL